MPELQFPELRILFSAISAMEENDAGVPSTPPDDLRCNRKDGKLWRCKRSKLEGKNVCSYHYRYHSEKAKREQKWRLEVEEKNVKRTRMKQKWKLKVEEKKTKTDGTKNAEKKCFSMNKTRENGGDDSVGDESMKVIEDSNKPVNLREMKKGKKRALIDFDTAAKKEMKEKFRFMRKRKRGRKRALIDFDTAAKKEKGFTGMSRLGDSTTRVLNDSMQQFEKFYFRRRKAVDGKEEELTMCNQCWRTDKGRVVWCTECKRKRCCVLERWTTASRQNIPCSSCPTVKATWTDERHKIFIELCVEQVQLGNKSGTHLTVDGWKNIIRGFHQRTGLEYDHEQLKNHWDATKEQWKVWKHLIGLSGLGWDPLKQTITATPEQWNDYIQRYPEAQQFRHRDLRFAKECDILFEGVITNRSYDYAPSKEQLAPDQLLQSFVQVNTQQQDICKLVPKTPLGTQVNQDFDVEGGNGIETSTSNLRHKSPTNLDPIPHCYGRDSGPMQLNSHIERVFSDLSSMTAPVQRPVHVQQDYSINACIECLHNIEGLREGSDLYLWAITHLFMVQKESREAFISIKSDAVRLTWLEYMKAQYDGRASRS